MKLQKIEYYFLALDDTFRTILYIKSVAKMKSLVSSNMTFWPFWQPKKGGAKKRNSVIFSFCNIFSSSMFSKMPLWVKSHFEIMRLSSALRH